MTARVRSIIGAFDSVRGPCACEGRCPYVHFVQARGSKSWSGPSLDLNVLAGGVSDGQIIPVWNHCT